MLFLHHAAAFGGASRSLLELIQSLPVGAVEALVLTRRGQFQEILKKQGVEVLGCAGVSQFDNTRYSHYRGWRWLVMLREMAYLPFTLLGLLAAKRRWGRVDLVHVNEITMLPSIWLARRIFACPVIVHARSVQQTKIKWRNHFISCVFRGDVAQVIAIDETVKKSLDPALNTTVIHNGLRIALSEEVPVKKKCFTVGMVGGLARAKGCLELVEAAALCLAQGGHIRFVFVGQSLRPCSPMRDFILKKIGLSQQIEEELNALIDTLGLTDTVEFWPFTMDLEQVYSRFDVICFPSHFDAPGRPVFEAAFFGVPSIVAVTQPTSDTIVDGVTGLTVRSRQPQELADAIMSLYVDPQKRLELGRNARQLAMANFDAEENAMKVLGVYGDVTRFSGARARL